MSSSFLGKNLFLTKEIKIMSDQVENSGTGDVTLEVSSASEVAVSSGTVAMSAASSIGAAAPADAPVAKTLDQKIASAEDAALGIDRFSPECQKIIHQTLAGSSLAAATMKEILTYVVEMDPSRAQTDATGGASQIRLYRAIQYFCDKAPADFQLTFATFMRIVLESVQARGAFYPIYLFRFLPSVALGPEDRRAFQSLMHVFVTLADPSTRAQAVKQIDFGVAFKSGLSDAGRQRVIAFFAI